jgi:hypothetical protein
VTDFGAQIENLLSVMDHNVQPAIGVGFVLEKQSHTRVADVHCLGRFRESDPGLTDPVHKDGNWERETLIAPLNCVVLITHKLCNRQFGLLVLASTEVKNSLSENCQTDADVKVRPNLQMANPRSSGY